MRRGRVIARIWRGWAPHAAADDYQRQFETQVSVRTCRALTVSGVPACCASLMALRSCSPR